MDYQFRLRRSVFIFSLLFGGGLLLSACSKVIPGTGNPSPPSSSRSGQDRVTSQNPLTIPGTGNPSPPSSSRSGQDGASQNPLTMSLDNRGSFNKSTAELLDLVNKSQVVHSIRNAFLRSPVINFFREFKFRYCQDSPQDKVCTKDYREKPLNAFIVDGTPTQEMVDLLSHLTTVCQKDLNSPSSFCNSFEFEIMKIIQKDHDLIVFLQNQKDFCERYPQERPFCTREYPFDSKSINYHYYQYVYIDIEEVLA